MHGSGGLKSSSGTAGREPDYLMIRIHLLNKKGGICMEADAIIQLIGSLGFPIAMCILIFWYLMKETENHKEEVSMLKDVIAKNTEALIELKDKLQE
jgi:hypothetical protein